MEITKRRGNKEEERKEPAWDNLVPRLLHPEILIHPLRLKYHFNDREDHPQ